MGPHLVASGRRRSLAHAGSAVLALLLLAVASPARAQSDTLGTVAGVVRGPSGAAIVGAEVVLTPVRAAGTEGTVFARRLFTDEEGRFRVSGLPNGRATLAVRRIGFRPTTRELDVPAPALLAVAMEAVPQTMTAVVVRDRRVKYEGWAARFYERRDRGMGRFVTKEDIERRNPIRTTDMLRSIPGLAVVPGAFSSKIRLRGARCDPLVWIDGSAAISGYLDVDNFAPNSLEGIEVYSGVATVPAELRGPRGEEACGVIALWSRMPEPRAKRGKKTYTADDLANLVASATVYTVDQVDQAAMPDSANPIAPYYPDAQKRARTAGEAIVEFVVDTAGVPEIETIGIVTASHPSFGSAARAAVSSARFSPARKSGRAVRQLVQVPVTFRPTGG